MAFGHILLPRSHLSEFSGSATIYMYVCMYCLYIYTYIDVNALAQGINPFWPHTFGFKPLLGLEPMAPIRPQLLVSHANHSATETSMYVCMYVLMYVWMYVCINVCMYVCINLCMYVCLYLSLCISIYLIYIYIYI